MNKLYVFILPQAAGLNKAKESRAGRQPINRSKGARGPDQWKPEDSSYWCQYAIDWASIKNTWNLTVTEPEHRPQTTRRNAGNVR